MKLPTIFRPRVSISSPERGVETRTAADVTAGITRLREMMGIAETFIAPCACARHDRGFSVRFERINPAHKFRIASIDKDDGDTNGAAGDAPRLIELPIDQVDTSGWHCPWCGNRDSTVLCGRCRVFVCRGRTTCRNNEEWFVCRESCGRQGGSLRPLERLTGSEGQDERANETVRAVRLALPRYPSVPLLGKPKR